MAADLRASTSLTSGKGSPYAAELDRKLAGDGCLGDIIGWWVTEYFAWRGTQPDPGDGGPSLLDLTDNETTVLTLDIGGELTEDSSNPEVRVALGYMREARAALRAAAAAGGQAQA
jgi:hypothetical protein